MQGSGRCKKSSALRLLTSATEHRIRSRDRTLFALRSSAEWECRIGRKQPFVSALCPNTPFGPQFLWYRVDLSRADYAAPLIRSSDAGVPGIAPSFVEPFQAIGDGEAGDELHVLVAELAGKP